MLLFTSQGYSLPRIKSRIVVLPVMPKIGPVPCFLHLVFPFHLAFYVLSNLCQWPCESEGVNIGLSLLDDV